MTPRQSDESNQRTGIDVSNVKVGGGIIGLVVSILTVFIFLAGIPALRWFPAGAAAAGLIFSIGIRVCHEKRPVRLGGPEHPGHQR